MSNSSANYDISSSLMNLADNLVSGTKNPLHQKLAGISKKCHRLKLEGKEKEIKELERENDELGEQLLV